MSDAKTSQSITRSIKSITKASSSLTPSQKRKLTETIVPTFDDETLDELTSFFNFLSESRQAIKEKLAQEELDMAIAKEALIETLKGTDAFVNSRKSPEDFILELLNSSSNNKSKKSNKNNSSKPTKPTPNAEASEDINTSISAASSDTQEESTTNNSFHQRPSY